ncbi:hypothetical protein [Streptomyces gilvosporeus]|uniref:Uncharacterized protein n=1 Tax=Streptomyces gilvosporeus TaxID=553510 RepID=A0A1V0TK77_9ACTN|nr:hypothetical protein [Streptomyces gilvosporeus]ARF53347.1 hypothetical protein B1H19_03470 [Streptomyces gilvosporeus]
MAPENGEGDLVRWFEDITAGDTDVVGGAAAERDPGRQEHGGADGTGDASRGNISFPGVMSS